MDPRPSADASGTNLDARSAIVRAAASLMAARGVSATSLDDVVSAAASERGELHYHFADKGELVRAVIVHQLNALLAVQPAIDLIDTWDSLERWVEDVVTAQKGFEQPFVCPLGSLAVELKNDQRFSSTIDSAFRAWEHKLADGLRSIQAGGGLDARADPDRLAASLLAALQGGYLLASIHGDPAVIRDTLEGAVAGLRRYRV